MKGKVLLVDTDDDFVAATRAWLQQAGFAVAVAHTVGDARQWLSEETPALAILGVMLDRSDGGFTLAYEIKKLDPLIPVILVTAVTRETGLDFNATCHEEREWVRADALLAKPVRFEQLEREIGRLMNGLPLMAVETT